jgi:uridine kinase
VTPLGRIIASIDTARSSAPLVLVGIGGHGGSGKSTLAARIAEVADDVQIVGTDSFWDGSGFDLDRLRREVVDALLTAEIARYDEWDWHAKRVRPGRTVAPSGVVIIEGVCALHQMFRDDLAVRIWIEAPHDVRLERGVARDGEAARSTWIDVWMPNEAAYVERDDPISCAQLVVDGTAPFG